LIIIMRKLASALVLGLGLAAGVTTTSLAAETWPSFTVAPTVTPNKAGTPSHPQGVQIKTVFHWQLLGEASQPIVTNFHVLFPKGSLYNGSKYTTCSLGRLNSAGPGGCPKASIMGSGTGNAYADQVITHPQITVVNGGAKTVYFYTVLNNPARVQQPVIGHITRMSGKWAYALSVAVPQDLQIVAGVPIELTYLTVHAGKSDWLATTACPGGHWPFQITTQYLDPNTDATGSYTYSSSAACRK
jgi:hypothetical protein